MSTNGRTQIVILGGGFGGVYTAMHLEKQLAHEPDVDLVLVASSYRHRVNSPVWSTGGASPDWLGRGVVIQAAAMAPIASRSFRISCSRRPVGFARLRAAV